MQLEETPVVFVRLRDDDVVLAHQQVRPIILRYAPQEGGASLPALGEDVRDQSGCGGLAVRACDCEAFLAYRDFSKHAAALDHAVTVLAHVLQLLHAVRDSRGIDHQRVLHPGGDIVRVVFVVDGDSFLFQLAGKVGGRAVVSAHAEALELVVAGYGAHSNAAYPYEVYVRVCHLIPVCIFLPQSSRPHRAWPMARRSFQSLRSSPGRLRGRSQCREVSLPLRSLSL